MIAPVPDCLLPIADVDAWVAWNFEHRGDELRKVPRDPRTGAYASVADSRSWGTLSAAQRLAEARSYSGFGIVSAAVPAMVFLDLDRCLDPASGEPTNHDAVKLLNACSATYAERTPSGTGLRIIGTAPEIQSVVSRRCTTPCGLALEIYKAAPRYLTVTARRHGGHPDTLANIGNPVLELLRSTTPVPTVAGASGQEDAQLIRRVITGEGFHAELCALAARYIGRGLSGDATTETLRGLMLAFPEPARDGRWKDRFASIPNLVASAARKYGEATRHRRELAKVAGRMFGIRRPSAEVRSVVLADAAARGIEVAEAEQIMTWVVTREIARREAANV